jgi:TPR repeat protein
MAFDFIRRAAEMGDKGSILYIARSYDNGTGLRSTESINWTTAIQWYNRFLASSGSYECTGSSDDQGYSDACDEPAYLVIARTAEIYSVGGNGVEKNAQEAFDLYNEAAEKATAFG